MAINKVTYGNQTLIDLSTDTVASSDDILLGKVGHLRDGTVVTGTASGGDPHGTIWQDGQGNVHLDDESGIALQSKTVTPTESQQVIEADEGYYALDTVTVGAISSSYVGSGVTRRSSSDLTVSGATVTAPAGYYSASASKAVATGTAGTPTATKGTVSNNSVTVTPSVTNTGGYISGSTKTGTAVTVSASELVSGTKSITENGTGIDVTNYASVNVDVSTGITPSGTYSITNNGTYNISQYASVNVSVGGVPDPVSMDDPVRFFDYDGTLLYSYSASDFQALTAMPANPSHGGLTSQGWNWTLADAKAQLTAMGACDIGQMYVTDDGKTRLYCHFEEGRLAPYLGICPNGTVMIDWGDSTATDTLTGTSLTTVKRVQHTYASAGDYVITLTATSGTFGFLGTTNGTYLLQKTETNSQYISNVYTNSIRKIELGNGVSLGNHSFYNCFSMESVTMSSAIDISTNTYVFSFCYSLKYVTIPSSVTSIFTSSFSSCNSLKTISMPKSLTSFANNSFANCYGLERIVIPNGLTTIGSYSFSACYSLTEIKPPSTVTSIGTYSIQNCYSLNRVTIPNSVTNIMTNTFFGCRSLSKITVPSGITSIAASAFSGCYGLAEIHFKPETPPTVSNTNAFTNLQTDCKIYVPTGTLSAYTSATNYPSSETYTYVEE